MNSRRTKKTHQILKPIEKINHLLGEEEYLMEATFAGQTLVKVKSDRNKVSISNSMKNKAFVAEKKTVEISNALKIGSKAKFLIDLQPKRAESVLQVA